MGWTRIDLGEGPDADRQFEALRVQVAHECALAEAAGNTAVWALFLRAADRPRNIAYFPPGSPAPLRDLPGSTPCSIISTQELELRFANDVARAWRLAV